MLPALLLWLLCGSALHAHPREAVLLDSPRVSASNVDFGIVNETQFPKDRILTLTNSGAVPVTVTAASFRPGSPFRVQSGLPVTVAAGSTAPLIVRFSDPVTQASYTDTCVFTYAPQGAPLTAVLTGRKVYRTSIEGPPQMLMTLAICETGPKDSVVTLTNPGSTPLVISSITLSNDSNFTLTPPLFYPFSIPAGESREVGLRFDPKSSGRKYATLLIASNAVNAPLYKLPLEGVKESAELVALSLYFGNLTPAFFPATRTLAIRNAGTVPVTVDSLLFGAQPPFVVTGGTPVTLQPSETGSISIRFDDPGKDGYFSDTLTIHHTPTCGTLKILVAGTRASSPKIAGPSTLRFNDMLCALAPKDTTIIISNTGAFTLIIGAITFSGDPDFSAPTALPRSILAGASDTIRVRFTPTGWGFKAASMMLSSNAANEPAFSIELFATADRPALQRGAIDFGQAFPADFPVLAKVWIHNPGVIDVRLDSASFDAATPFSFATPLPLVVAPGDSALVDILFEDPGTDGGYTRAMRLHYTPFCAPTTVQISGSRYSRPQIAAPDSIRFETLRCAGSSRDTVILLRNTGGGELAITGVQVTGDAAFSLIGAPSFPARIAPRNALPLTVRFAPLTPGQHIGQILASSNSVVSSALVVPLRGAKDSLGLAALAADFGTLQPMQLPASTQVRVTNTGSVDAVITGAQFSRPAPFSSTAGLPFVLTPGASRLVNVTFALPGADGLYTDTLRVTSEPGCEALLIPVRGTQRTRPEFTAPASVGFAALLCDGDFRDTLVTIRNTGGVDLNISDAGITGDADFSLVPAFAPFVIAKFDSATLRVRFLPLSPGDKAATLRIVNSARDTITLTVSLSGRRELVAMRVASIDFGSLLGAALPADRIVSVRNTGTVPLTVGSVTSSAGAVFTVISGLPATIATGDSAAVTIRFNDPGIDTAITATLAWNAMPQCVQEITRVAGERLTATATLRVGDASAAPGELVGIPILLDAPRNLALAGANGFRVKLRFNRTLLRPLAGDPGATEGGDRVLSLVLPAVAGSDGVLAVLHFEAALGTDSSTALTLEDVAAIDGPVTVSTSPGRFSLNRLCREGGTRLVNPDGVIALHANAPNPFNPMTEIRYEVIEAAPTRLVVRNSAGREVALLVDRVMSAGKYSVLFDGSALPSGVYFAVLETPTRTLSRPMLLVK